MKFKKGDKVSFLNETGGGIVNRIDDRGFIFVLTEDGFEIPVTERELVFSGGFSFRDRNDDIVEPLAPSADPSSSRKKEKGSGTVKADTPAMNKNVSADTPVTVGIGFIPDQAGPVFNSDIACFLINDSPFLVYYLIGTKEGGVLYFLSSGYVEPETKSHLKTFDQTSLSKISDLHVQLIFVSKGKYTRKDPVDEMIRMTQINFSKESYYRENEYFEEKAVIFHLLKEESALANEVIVPQSVIDLKKGADSGSQKVQKKEPVSDTLQVDLHFDPESVQNGALNPSAILTLQMSRFHAAVEEAIAKNLKRLVVIHGIGQGTLKMQIRKEIQEKYPAFVFQDASFKEYGFGATMIHLNLSNKQ